MTSLKFKSAVPSNYSIFAAILAVLIGIFFTYDIYNESLQKSEELTALRATSTSLTTTLDTLNTLKKSADTSKESEKYI